MRHKPRKRFSQNFLIDQLIISQIIAAIHPHKHDKIVEIGPGLGALTYPLLREIDHLDAIEIDQDIVDKLSKELPQERLTIHTADALNFNFSILGAGLRIVGNLPYNISTPLLFHLNKFSEQILDMHLMLQREVVERMLGQPNTPYYGRLSVMLQYRFEMEHLFNVAAESFRPIPKVESAIVRMIPRYQSIRGIKNEALLSQIVSAAFSQRRKTLRNTLYSYLKAEDFNALGINPGLRAENLSVTDFIAIANFLS